MKLTTHFHAAQKLRMHRIFLHSSTHAHDVSLRHKTSLRLLQ